MRDMALSELVIEWSNAYVKDFQDRFLPTVERYLREQIPELEGHEITWTSELNDVDEIKLEKKPLEQMVYGLIFEVGALKIRLDKMEKTAVEKGVKK